MDKKKKTIIVIIILLLLLVLGGIGAGILIAGSKTKAAELEAVKKSMSLEGLQDYLAKHPGEASSDKIKQLSHDVRLSATLADNEIATYESFLADYPQSAGAAEIKENLAWLRSEADHSSATYETFIQANPQSLYVPRAKLRIGQNDFWTRTKPTRDAFQKLLVTDDSISAEFYPQFAEYAAKLVAYDLIQEAAAILAVLQHHHSEGAMACLNMSLSVLSFGSMADQSLSEMEEGLYRSKVYQAKSNLMQGLDYSDTIDSINDLAVSGDVEMDTKGFLLDQAGGAATDEAELLARKLKYIKITPFFVMYPDFVGECVSFLGKLAPTKENTVLDLLSALHIPESAGYIAAASSQYAPSTCFNGLGMIARRYREQLLANLDTLDDKGKAVLVYGFGIADDRRAEEKITSILNTTGDAQLKVACWYALSRFGRDHTPELNKELAAALSFPVPTDIAGDILTAFQWMRDKGLEKQIDPVLVKKALNSEDSTVLFFAQAILEDLETDLDVTTIKRVLELARSENKQVSERAAALLGASQKSLQAVMQNDFAAMNDNQKAMIVSSLQKDSYEKFSSVVRPFIDAALSDSFKGDDTAKNQVIGSVGTLGLKDLDGKLLTILDADESIRAGISLALLYQDAPEAGLAKLAPLSSAAALTARAYLGDETAVSALKARIDSYDIEEVLEGINYGKLLNNPGFYGRFYSKMRYSNSSYAPTDYLVAFSAQNAALDLLLNNRSLRQEIRAKL